MVEVEFKLWKLGDECMYEVELTGICEKQEWVAFHFRKIFLFRKIEENKKVLVF